MPLVEPSSRSRKRRAPCDRSIEDGYLPIAKRYKSSASSVRHHEPSPEFWDRLSRAFLSRRALWEFDRRTVGQSHPAAPPAPASRDLPLGPQLTRLKRFARRGGPSLTHLRGVACLPLSMSNSGRSSRKRPSTSSTRLKATTTSKTSPYSGQYEEALIDEKIFPEGHDYEDDEPDPAANQDDIQRQLAVERASLSPSQFTAEHFRRFKRANANAQGESMTMRKVLSIIAGTDDHFATEGDREFNHMKPFNEGLTAAKPDLYDGERALKIDKSVRTQLDDLIIPCTKTSYPVAPNFFMEGKSASGRADVAKLQACHDGAIGARVMHSLQNYGVKEAVYDGNAYSFTSTYHNGTGTLQLYTTHPTAPKAPGGPAEYHMTQIDSYAMTGSLKKLREGATAYRNVRDLAKTHRDTFIKQANETARHAPADTSPSTVLDSCASLSSSPEVESDTSIDELPAPAKRSRHATREGNNENTDRIATTNSRIQAALSNSNQEGLVDTSHTRRTRSSSKPPPIEVVSIRAVWNQQAGRTFELRGQQIFVPDAKWHKGTRKGSAAWVNSQYNVWCYDD